VVKSNDKKRARLEAIKHVLRKFDYDGKNEEAIGEPDKMLLGPPSMLSEHNADLKFPDLKPPPRELPSRTTQRTKRVTATGHVTDSRASLSLLIASREA
jgi:hypothetical protein